MHVCFTDDTGSPPVLPLADDSGTLERLCTEVRKVSAGQEQAATAMEKVQDNLGQVLKLLAALTERIAPVEDSHAGAALRSMALDAIADGVSRSQLRSRGVASMDPRAFTASTGWHGSRGMASADPRAFTASTTPRISNAFGGGSRPSLATSAMPRLSASSPVFYTPSGSALPPGWPGCLTLRKGLEVPQVDRKGRAIQMVPTVTMPDSRSDRGAALDPWRCTFPRRNAWFRALEPNSSLVSALAWVDLAVLMHDVLVTPYVLAWDVIPGPVLSSLQLLAVLYWTSYVLKNCRIGFYLHGELHMDTMEVFCRYLKRQFLFDSGLVVLDWMALYMGRSGNTSYLKVGRALRMMKMFRLAVAGSMVAKLLGDAYQRNQRLIILVTVALSTLFTTHLMGCAWFALGQFAPSDTSSHWTVATFGEDMGHGADGVSRSYVYLTAFHWALGQITLGGTEVTPTNSFERAFSIALMIFGLLFGSIIVSVVSAQASEFVAMKREALEKTSVLNRFLLQNVVSKSLAYKVRRQAKQRIKDQRTFVSEDDVAAIKFLSSALRSDLRHQTRIPHLSRHPLFRVWVHLDSSALPALCDAAVSFVTLSHEDCLFTAGSAGNDAYYVVKGSLSYCIEHESGSEDLERDIKVGDGTWIAEGALWTNWTHVGTLESEGPCMLLAISASGLLQVAQQHPYIRHATCHYGRQFHARVVAAGPPNSRWPTDLHVPCTNASDLLAHDVGLALLRRERLEGRLPIDANDYDALKEEVRSQLSAIVEIGATGHLERVVALSVLHLTHNNWVFLQVGTWPQGEKQKAQCMLPGAKRIISDLPGQAMLQFIADELAPLASYICFEGLEEEAEVKESERFGLRTKYLKTVHRATFDSACDVPKLPVVGACADRRRAFQSGISVTGTMRFNSTQDDGGRWRERLRNTEVHGIAGANELRLYAWVPVRDCQSICGPDGLGATAAWFAGLQWTWMQLPGEPDTAIPEADCLGADGSASLDELRQDAAPQREAVVANDMSPAVSDEEAAEMRRSDSSISM